jgi:hypothetical protein
MDACRFCTLTLDDDGQSLDERLDRLMQSFRRLRRSPRWRACVRGGAYAIQTTRGRDGQHWHVHLHLLIDGTYYHQRELSADWLAATGDSSIVDIRAAHSRTAVATYVAEYVARPDGLGTWAAAHIREYAETMHGRRMIHTWGSCHGTAVDESAADRPSLSQHRISAALLAHNASQGHTVSQYICDVLARTSGVARAIFDGKSHPQQCDDTEYGIPLPTPPPASTEEIACVCQLLIEYDVGVLLPMSAAQEADYIRRIAADAQRSAADAADLARRTRTAAADAAQCVLW